jgi:hypothetical protein
MKHFLFSVLIVIVFCSCNKTNIAIKERIENADSAAINYFMGDGTMDTVVAVKKIRDKEILAQLTNLVAETSTNITATCGIDGSLHFFKQNMVVQDIDFTMDEKKGCMQFAFKLGKDEALSNTKLSPTAKALLVKLSKK